ncbi:MAG: hypothetical protein WCC48_16265 [Anaeromyxobacteraceae bacterium]
MPSPSGEFRAVVFDRGCGATTGFSTQVSLLRHGERLSNTGGNALVVDSGNAPLPLQVKPEWVSDRVLRLTYDPRLRTFTRAASVAGVTVIHASSPAALRDRESPPRDAAGGSATPALTAPGREPP